MSRKRALVVMDSSPGCVLQLFTCIEQGFKPIILFIPTCPDVATQRSKVLALCKTILDADRQHLYDPKVKERWEKWGYEGTPWNFYDFVARKHACMRDFEFLTGGNRARFSVEEVETPSKTPDAAAFHAASRKEHIHSFAKELGVHAMLHMCSCVFWPPFLGAVKNLEGVESTIRRRDRAFLRQPPSHMEPNPADDIETEEIEKYLAEPDRNADRQKTSFIPIKQLDGDAVRSVHRQLDRIQDYVLAHKVMSSPVVRWEDDDFEIWDYIHVCTTFDDIEAMKHHAETSIVLPLSHATCSGKCKACEDINQWFLKTYLF